jgi:hypothetical protein
MPTPGTEARNSSVLPVILLGVAATLLTLFVEFQLLKATNVPLAWPQVGAREASMLSGVEPRDKHLDGANKPTLQVRARPIVPGSRTTLVTQGE